MSTEPDSCPHGHGRMSRPVPGDPLEPGAPYCVECGHIQGRPCSDGCHYREERSSVRAFLLGFLVVAAVVLAAVYMGVLP